MKKKMKSKALAILMSLTMAFTMMPMMGAPAYADDPAPPAPGIEDEDHKWDAGKAEVTNALPKSSDGYYEIKTRQDFTEYSQIISNGVSGQIKVTVQ